MAPKPPLTTISHNVVAQLAHRDKTSNLRRHMVIIETIYRF